MKIICTDSFSDCNITTVNIPEGVTTIEPGAFLGSTLKSVSFPNSLTEIGSDAFFNTALTSIILPNNVTTIGAKAFRWCTFKSIVIPKSVTTIGRYAFADCDGLTIYCEAPSKPEGWDEEWMSNPPFDTINDVTVVWGYSVRSLGDPSGDGKVNANDYMMLKRHVLHTFKLTADQIAVVDINKDSKVNATDYMLLKRAVLGTYKLPTA